MAKLRDFFRVADPFTGTLSLLDKKQGLVTPKQAEAVVSTPTPDTAAESAEEARRKRLAEKTRGGRAGTILTSPLGAAGVPPVVRKTLLGM